MMSLKHEQAFTHPSQSKDNQVFPSVGWVRQLLVDRVDPCTMEGILKLAAKGNIT